MGRNVPWVAGRNYSVAGAGQPHLFTVWQAPPSNKGFAGPVQWCRECGMLSWRELYAAARSLLGKSRISKQTAGRTLMDCIMIQEDASSLLWRSSNAALSFPAPAARMANDLRPHLNE